MTIINTDLVALCKIYKSGKDFEFLVELAILIHILRAVLSNGDHPFMPNSQAYHGELVSLPIYMTKVEDADAFISKTMARLPPNTLVYFRPTHTQFNQFDGFLSIFENGILRTQAFQMKLSKERPQKIQENCSDWIESTFWIQGHPKDEEDSSCEDETVLVGSKKLRELFGFSLSPLIAYRWNEPGMKKSINSESSSSKTKPTKGSQLPFPFPFLFLSSF